MKQLEQKLPGPQIANAELCLMCEPFLYPAFNQKWVAAVTEIPSSAWIDPRAKAIAETVCQMFGAGEEIAYDTVFVKLASVEGITSYMCQLPPALYGFARCVSTAQDLVDILIADYQRRTFDDKRARAADALVSKDLTPDEARNFLGDLDLFEYADAQNNKRKDISGVINEAIEGKRKPVHIPWRLLDSMTHALYPGCVCVVCGSPGSGKSWWLLETVHAIHLAGEHVAFYTVEEDRNFHLLRLLAQLSSEPNITDLEWLALHKSDAKSARDEHIEKLNSFSRRIQDAPKEQPKMADLSAWVRSQCKAGARLVIVDPVSVSDAGKEPWRAAGAFMGIVDDAARTYGASVIVSTHPRKGAVYPPDLDQVSGGTDFTRRAQSVLWIERHSDDREANVTYSDGTNWNTHVNRTVHILKSRNSKHQGARLSFKFDGDISLRFQELGIENRQKHGKGSWKQNDAVDGPFTNDTEDTF